MSYLNTKAITTRVLRLREPLVPFLIEHLKDLNLEGKVLAITSKIVSLSDGCVIEKDKIDKRTLIEQESEVFLGETIHGVNLTIKEGILIPSAGIDESNAEGDYYILYPENPKQSVQRIRKELKDVFGLNHFGLILTDSHTTPLRKGVMGFALAHAGFHPINDLVGSPDIFGRKMKMTSVNVADALSCAAVLTMGEAAERAPLAVIETDRVHFTEKDCSKDLLIPPAEDLYGAFFIKTKP